MVLHAEDGLVACAAGPSTVPSLRLRCVTSHVGRQRVGIDREAVILRRDLDLPGLELLHRLIRAAVAELQLVRLAAQRQAQQLMAEADAEDRHARSQAASWTFVDGVGRAAGSPGPLERKMPSGLVASRSAAGAAAGHDVTSQPCSARQRRMFHFMPKSNATMRSVRFARRSAARRIRRPLRVTRRPTRTAPRTDLADEIAAYHVGNRAGAFDEIVGIEIAGREHAAHARRPTAAAA